MFNSYQYKPALQLKIQTSRSICSLDYLDKHWKIEQQQKPIYLNNKNNLVVFILEVLLLICTTLPISTWVGTILF